MIRHDQCSTRRKASGGSYPFLFRGCVLSHLAYPSSLRSLRDMIPPLILDQYPNKTSCKSASNVLIIYYITHSFRTNVRITAERSIPVFRAIPMCVCVRMCNYFYCIYIIYIYMCTHTHTAHTAHTHTLHTLHALHTHINK